MRLLIYAYRDWSFWNIEPVLKYFEYDRWWLEKGGEPNWNEYDLILSCEPHIEGWREVYSKLAGQHKILGLQHSLYWSERVNPNASWLFDKFLMYGEQQKEVCLRYQISEDRLFITGNPRYDKFFGIKTEDHGYTLILGSSEENIGNYSKYVDRDTRFIGHPDTRKQIPDPNTENAIRCARRVIFRDTGAGIIAMIMGKPVLITEGRDARYFKCPMYNRGEFGIDYDDFVTWAVTGSGATGRVRGVIEREIWRNDSGRMHDC